MITVLNMYNICWSASCFTFRSDIYSSCCSKCWKMFCSFLARKKTLLVILLPFFFTKRHVDKDVTCKLRGAPLVGLWYDWKLWDNIPRVPAKGPCPSLWFKWSTCHRSWSKNCRFKDNEASAFEPTRRNLCSRTKYNGRLYLLIFLPYWLCLVTNITVYICLDCAVYIYAWIVFGLQI